MEKEPVSSISYTGTTGQLYIQRMELESSLISQTLITENGLKI